ncbi:DJ-1 family glyoxalase III [Campylobacter showae]|uniref:DJ-1 family glyoxalase III n=1 Tax=Campylobacter showae TaxID=204 RepID=UPI0026F0F8CF|nr:DJ-1 family glyoxalase III [Campylobacter showae]
MKKIAVIFADGFEEIEGVSIVDVLRRGGVEAHVVGLDKLPITGAHGVKLVCDMTLYDLEVEEYDMLVLPGGYTGVTNISGNLKMRETIKKFAKKGKFVAAICAAPIALGVAEVMSGEYTCYPSCEKAVRGGSYVSDRNVVINGRIITSRGPATAMEFALELVKILNGEQVYNEVKNELLFVK